MNEACEGWVDVTDEWSWDCSDEDTPPRFENSIGDFDYLGTEGSVLCYRFDLECFFLLSSFDPLSSEDPIIPFIVEDE